MWHNGSVVRCVIVISAVCTLCAQVLFRKLLFDEFYMPELSAAGAAALATTTATSVDPNHQCPLSLAIVSYLRSANLIRQVQQVTTAQEAAASASNGGAGGNGGPVMISSVGGC